MQKERVGTAQIARQEIPSRPIAAPQLPVLPQRIAHTERRLRETADYFPPQSFQASTNIRLVLVPFPFPCLPPSTPLPAEEIYFLTSLLETQTLPPEPVTCVSLLPDPPEVLVTVYVPLDPETPTVSPTEIPWFVW